MNLLFGHDATVAGWCEGKMGRKMGPWFKAVGVINNEGRLVGAATFHDYNSHNIEAAYYGPGTMTKDVYVGLAQYCFEVLKVTRITARTTRKNRHINKGLPRLGFRLEGVSKHYFGPLKRDDAINYVALRSDFEKFMGHAK
jgi:RimJ/RimL family protein N-acetyltransferase